MQAKTVRHILFWTSILFWAFGWVYLYLTSHHIMSAAMGLDALLWWSIGAFLGVLWLILKIIQLAARTWNSEKAAAGR